MDYVCSDLHGNIDELLGLLSKVEFGNNDNLYILGDLIDRGTQNLRVLNFAMEHCDNVVAIKGNHEQMMLRAFGTNEEEAYHHWFENGGQSTFTELRYLTTAGQRNKYLNFISSLSDYILINEDILLVHSGINVERIDGEKSFKELMKYQTESDIYWSRENFYRRKAINGKIIVFGHTPTPLIRGDRAFEEKRNFLEIPTVWIDEVYQDKICIDCGMGYKKLGGRLALLCLDDMKVYYS